MYESTMVSIESVTRFALDHIQTLTDYPRSIILILAKEKVAVSIFMKETSTYLLPVSRGMNNP